MAEKVYPYMKTWMGILGFLGCLALFFLVAFLYSSVRGLGASILEYLFLFSGLLSLGNTIYYLVSLVVGLRVKEIALSEGGIVFRRRFRPVTIQSVVGVKTVTGRGRWFRKTETALVVEGFTPEGKSVRRLVRRASFTDLDKRWEEFKSDVQAYAVPPPP